MQKIPKQSKLFWANINGFDIEIDYYVYDTYTQAFANYYYWEEDSVAGEGIGKTPKDAVRCALYDLMKEIHEFYSYCDIIHTKNPFTNDDAVIAIYPKQK